MPGCAWVIVVASGWLLCAFRLQALHTRKCPSCPVSRSTGLKAGQPVIPTLSEFLSNVVPYWRKEDDPSCCMMGCGPEANYILNLPWTVMPSVEDRMRVGSGVCTEGANPILFPSPYSTISQIVLPRGPTGV